VITAGVRNRPGHVACLLKSLYRRKRRGLGALGRDVDDAIAANRLFPFPCLT